MFKKSKSRDIKSRARKSLSKKFSLEKRSYVIDTSAIINKFMPDLIRKGIKGKLIIPNAVMAELENLANKGKEEGFIGLEEITKLHRQSKLKITFQGSRPNEYQIKHAKSGEIDAMIRNLARHNRAILITSDLVQAKSSQAYGLQILFLMPKQIKKKKSFFSFFKKR